jgi:hypothetical protein
VPLVKLTNTGLQLLLPLLLRHHCAGGTAKCGDVCYDTDTQCCANADKSTIGEPFGGGCVGGDFCVLPFGKTAIVGRRCKDRGNACFECCSDTDCPSVGLGERCVSGVCSMKGCTAFSCWASGETKNLCGLDGKGCSSGSSGNTVRCPSGTCYDNGCTPSCGNKECCSAVSVDCKKGSMDGRRCRSKCDGEDPYFGTNISKVGSYPTCPKGEGKDPE